MSTGRTVLLALHYDDDDKSDNQPTLMPLDPLLLHTIGDILDKNKIHQKCLVSMGTNVVFSFIDENGNNIDIDNNTEINELKKKMGKTKKQRKINKK
jgi:hypothetical protein